MNNNIGRIIANYLVIVCSLMGCTGTPVENASSLSATGMSNALSNSSALNQQSSSSQPSIHFPSTVAMTSSMSEASSQIAATVSSSNISTAISSQSSLSTLFDECNTTAQCRELYGENATDCKDSASVTSWCACGDEPCIVSSSSATLSSEPSNPNGGASWGQGGEVGPRTHFPCTGCLFDTPTEYSHDSPTPLLITLHGDEGHPASIHRVYNEQPGFGKKAGFIVASLKCPKSLNCDQTASVAPGSVKANYSWWLWQRFIPEHDPSWINRQVDKIERQYNIDLSRVYLAGFSGGTTYISTWGVDNSNRYAGMILSAGGGLKEVETKACDQQCPLAVVISTGLDDFLHPNAKASRDFAQRCGHELLYRETAGKGHTFIGKDINEGLKWLLNRPHNCINSP